MRAAGRVARSQDLNSALILLGSLLALVATGGALVDFLVSLMVGSLGGQSWTAWLNAGAGSAEQLAVDRWNVLAGGLAKVFLPVLALVALVALAVNVLQAGFKFLPERVVPDLSRVSPAAGLGRLFSGSSAVRLALGIAKIAAIVAVATVCINRRRDELASLAALDLAELVAYAWDACFWMCVEIGGALAVLAGVDYLFERWRFERALRMTPQEVREEMRELQANPQILARRRALASQRSVAAPGAVGKTAER
jgi:flagellar biosynthetic protein FlhB